MLNIIKSESELYMFLPNKLLRITGIYNKITEYEKCNQGKSKYFDRPDGTLFRGEYSLRC